MVQQQETGVAGVAVVRRASGARRLAVEVVVVVLCVIGAVWCWNHGVRTTLMAPTLPNSEPVGVTYYSGGWITLAALLAAVAGAIAVALVGRLVEPARGVPVGGMVEG